MGQFAVGEIVLVVFPFSDLKGQKLRPAFVLANAEFDNYILCQITSREYSSKNVAKLSQGDFLKGGLPQDSFVRLDKIFTADPEIIKLSVGKINRTKVSKILDGVRGQFGL